MHQQVQQGPAGLIAPMSKVSSDGKKAYGPRHAGGGGMPRRIGHTLDDVLDAQENLLENYKNALPNEETSAIIREDDNAKD
jgi:hypothetical protein